MAAEGALSDLLRDSGYAAAQNEYLEKLPLEQKKRLSALKALQQKSLEIEGRFYERVQQLEKEFENEFNNVFNERRKIIDGEREPTAEEAALPIIHGMTEDEIKDLNEKSEPDTGVKGIPEFWLNVLRGSELAADSLHEHDEPILKHLKDITTEVYTNPPGFSLFFHFSPNPFFKNATLKKYYELSVHPDPTDPFDFDGPTLIKSVGDKIDWEDGKDITKKVVKKKVKKGPSAGKMLTKSVRAESFFNFFDPPQAPNEDDEDAEETNELLRCDYELGQHLRDNIIPRAVLFITGEYDEGADLFDYGGEEDDEDEDEDEE